ncbi:hypothetical protein ABEW34_09100 [Paenibacillus algorifonticola]|uniref:hypothetical protein n=1 Tax=Paenibacillus algorifonticola TaxID=684063 RepID=UPI003D28B827
MNLYILVEGRSEKYIYPAWLRFLLPELTSVQQLGDVDCNQYYLFSCGGYPNIIDDVGNAIEDMKEHSKFDYLMVVLDGDDIGIPARKQEVLAEAHKHRFDPDRLITVVQNPCIETWCLGNRKIFRRNPDSPEFQNCFKHFNVSELDPESMPLHPELSQYTTTAQYHEHYLKSMLADRGLSYTKGKGTKAVQNDHYFSEMIKRVNETNHLPSFRDFIFSMSQLKLKIHGQDTAAPSIES